MTEERKDYHLEKGLCPKCPHKHADVILMCGSYLFYNESEGLEK